VSWLKVPYEAGEEELLPCFSNWGDIVEATILWKRDGSGASQGCGFVTYATAEQAALANEAVHDRLALPGSTRVRTLIVRFANAVRI
jgi:RNA recognition motif. (a.k.a. RRM, RBD, or RNP domain)